MKRCCAASWWTTRAGFWHSFRSGLERTSRVGFFATDRSLPCKKVAIHQNAALFESRDGSQDWDQHWGLEDCQPAWRWQRCGVAVYPDENSGIVERHRRNVRQKCAFLVEIPPSWNER